MWENLINLEDEIGSSPSKHLLEEAKDSFSSSIRRTTPLKKKKIEERERERERETAKKKGEREEGIAKLGLSTPFQGKFKEYLSYTLGYIHED